MIFETLNYSAIIHCLKVKVKVEVALGVGIWTTEKTDTLKLAMRYFVYSSKVCRKK